MKQEKNTDKKKRLSFFFMLDFWVYTICVAGFLISLNLFRLDLFRTLTRLADPVGTITYKYKAAQRRFGDRVLWDRLQQESPVYDGDFIRTAELSEAKITFQSKAMIDLTQNSLIQIRMGKIDIKEGEVSADAASSSSALVLAFGENQVAVEAGAVASAGVDDGGLMLQVVEGNVMLTGNGQTMTAQAGEALALGEDIRAVPRVVVLSPRPAARFLNSGQGKLSIPFRLSRVNLDAEQPALLEIAEDRGFTRIVFSEETAGDEITADLETGSYFWRVSHADSEEPASNTLNMFPLKIIAAPPPVLIIPAEGYQYQFRVKKPAVRFQWAGSDEASSYLLEIADNPEMVDPVFTRDVRGTSLYTSELGPGVWYWRVRSVFSGDYEGTAGESKTSSFRIIQSGTLLPPELRSPADGDMVNIAADRRDDQYFSWRTEAEARSYTIIISANRNMSDPVITETIRDNFYVYRPGEAAVKEGLYYWTVVQTDVEGNNSAPSPVRAFLGFEGEVIQQTIFPPNRYIIGNTMLPELRFVWKNNLPFQTWLQISERADFSRLAYNETVSGESIQGRALPEGTWYWRIQTRVPTGSVFETPPKSFTVAPPLPAPVLEQPGTGSRIMVGEGEPAVFSWRAAEGAEYYRFRLYREEDRDNPVYENNTVEGLTERISLDPYPDGNYYWTVQGLAPESTLNSLRTGQIAESAFTVWRVYPVELEYPDDGAEIEGLSAYFEPGAVRWSASNRVTASRFILSRERNLTGEPVVVIDNPPASITLPRLREGTYYWTIRAGTEGGHDISAEAPRLIRVLPMPLLSEPAGLVPQDGTVITAPEPGQTLLLSFSWDAVSGAAAYLFSLTGEDGQELVRAGPLAETGYVLEDQAVLERGDFTWQVEAVYTEGQGIIRRGKVGKSRFRYEIPLPAPILKEPGVNAEVAVQKGKPVVFSWKPVEGAEYYQFKLYHGEEREKPVRENNMVEGVNQSILMEAFSEGNYSWTVEGFARDRGQGTERPGRQAEAAFSTIMIRPVRLESPDVELDGLRAYFEPGTLRWSASNRVLASRFILSRDRDFTGEPVAVIDDPPETIRLPRLREGDYYWTVRAETDGGIDISAEAPRFIRVLPMPLLPEPGGLVPQDGTVITAPDSGQTLPLSFSWDAVSGADAYLFSLTGEDGQDLVRAGPLAETGYVLEDLAVFERGDFTWQVEAVLTEADGIIRRGRSGGNRFMFEIPLPAPVLEEPRVNAEVAVQNGKPVVFSWAPVEGAESYRFKLYREEERDTPVYENNLVQGVNQSILMDAFSEGNYYWTVEGFARDRGRALERPGRQAEAAFSMRMIRPVRLESPDVELDGLGAYFEPGAVRWSPSYRVAASRFILSRDRDFTGEPVAVIDNPPETIRLPPLREGDYYWTIRAETDGGVDISAEAPRLIRVLPVPLLPEPGGLVPQDGMVITATDLRQNRRISFSWNEVSGATGYFFTLEHEGTGRIIMREGPLTETTIVLDDLTVLDVGTFIWRVEAVLTDPVRERREDEIIQRGEIGENRFRIDFALPDMPDLRKPGLLYGRDDL
ncbi:MAG: hypothetical protein LBP76_03730 [Treponema sp.]|jgi:hypothetical protein|nr:hypothetical protein [Treponema sp.]